MHGQITIRLNDELERGLEALASSLNRKRSDIVRLALEKLIGESGGELSTFEKTQQLAGSVDSGIKDLGENHREHLRNRFRRNA